MRHLLVIEDGTEYEEFARLFLAPAFELAAAHSGAEALALAARRPFDALLIDLGFARTPDAELVGDPQTTAHELFGGDLALARAWLRDQQGTLILAALRAAGCDAVAVFVHDFPAARLRNLRQLYGRVEAHPVFDAQRLLGLLQGRP